MNQLWGRSAVLIAVPPKGKGVEYSGITPAAINRPRATGPLIVQDPQDIDCFRIAFNVELTSEPNSNTATISVYNLNETSRAFLDSKRRDPRQVSKIIPPLTIQLKAGYGPNPEVIFTGNVDGDKTRTEKSGADVITTVESGDGRFTLRNTVINKTYAPGINLNQIIEDIQKQMGLKGNISGIQSETFQQGLTLSGAPDEILNNLTTKQDLEWSVQSGTLVIKKKNDTTNKSSIEISSHTGLVGIPKKTNQGIEFTSLINPALRPGKFIKVVSKYLKGDTYFVVRRVQFQGDNFQGPWTANVEAAYPGIVAVFKKK